MAPAIAGGPDDRPDVGATDRVERRGRLVEQDQLRFAEQRDAQPESLLHALGEAADRVARAIREPDPVERLVDGGAATAAGRCASRACRARTSRAVSQGWYRKSSGR